MIAGTLFEVVMLGSDVYLQVRLQLSTKGTERALENRTNFVRRELRTFNFVKLNKMTSEDLLLVCLVVVLQEARNKRRADDTAFDFDVSTTVESLGRSVRLFFSS